MFGIKIYEAPSDIDAVIRKWKDIGFDTVMTGRNCLKNTDFIREIHSAGLKLSVVEPVFLVPDEAEKAECAGGKKNDALFDRALLEDGSPAEEDWVRFICPTDERWLSHVYERIGKDAALGADILTFDFARFYQFWETVLPDSPVSSLKRTCYCERCKKNASAFKTQKEWRTTIVSQVVKNCAAAAKSVNPAVKTGVHIVPWKTDMFDGALEEVIGQNLRALSENVDFFAPMTYHHMIRQSPEYISELVKNHREYIQDRIPVVPSVQVKELYRNDVLPREEFRKAIKEALRYSTGGISFFQWNDIANSEENCKIIKQEISVCLVNNRVFLV